jgi:hypothetical protein
VPWDFGQPALLDRQPRLAGGARVGQDKHREIHPANALRLGEGRCDAILSIHGFGIRQDAGRCWCLVLA